MGGYRDGNLHEIDIEDHGYKVSHIDVKIDAKYTIKIHDEDEIVKLNGKLVFEKKLVNEKGEPVLDDVPKTCEDSNVVPMILMLAGIA